MKLCNLEQRKPHEWNKYCNPLPYFVAGIAGTLATVLYGVYSYKNRGPMSTSRYIMKFRVLAQGAVVCAMIVGATLSTKR